MHVCGFPIDLHHPLLQFLFTALLIAIALLYLLKSAASNYFVAHFHPAGDSNRDRHMLAVAATGDACAVCGSSASKTCARCKKLRYCSTTCQSEHWRAGHKLECKLKSLEGQNATISGHSKSSKEFPQLEKVLFPYEDFVKLFNWENMRFFPCGLLNCGNSCYANVVLQCLSSTRPLVAYLLEIHHARKCKRNDWCFLCELEAHVDRVRHSCQPFSPINILSRLPNIGGNLGYGKQEDAHEFMRFAIDTMQSVCLDEFGGEKAIHPCSQETTLIQYIFGGQLQSQVKCSKCHKISYRHENMMDLTVEIQGDAESLEKCLDQFTAEEWLDGDNMYKCDGCNDYVKACKRLAIHQAPNILTIALKRFQSGRFGKLNKRVTFPETLDLGPYMSEPGCGSDIYRLYAVVVHIDMLNASYFGHYICYVKDFFGNWYRIDDCKVETVELEEVLSQGAYMLLYSRISVRPSCVKSPQICKEENQQMVDMVKEAQPCTTAVESVAFNGPDLSVSTVEEQQGQNVSERTQPCSPVSESIDVEGSFNSLSTVTTDARSLSIRSSEKDDVLVSVDDSVKADTRFAEDATTSTVDILTDSKSCLMDMDLDGSSTLDQLLAGGDEMDVDLGNPDPSSLRDEFSTSQSDAAGAVSFSSPTVIQRGNSSEKNTAKPAIDKSCPNVKPRPLFSAGFLDRRPKRKPTNSNGSVLAKPGDVGMPCKVSSNGNGITEPAASQHTNVAYNHRGLHSNEQNSIFTPGFLDKRVRCKSQNGNGSAIVKPSDVCLPCKPLSACNGFMNHSQSIDLVHEGDARSQNGNGNVFIKSDEVGAFCKLDRNCNGFTQSVASQSIHMVHDANGESEYGNGNVLVNYDEVGKTCRLDNDCNGSTGPADSRNINVVHHGNGTFNSERQHSPSQCTLMGEVESSCPVRNLNGCANPGPLHNTEHHNSDRNFECHNLVKCAKLGYQCDDIPIDDDEQVDGEADVCSHNFVDNPSRKKSLEKECPSLSDYHNCNKLSKVG